MTILFCHGRDPAPEVFLQMLAFAEDDEVYLAVDPRHCVLLEGEPLTAGR